MVIFVFAATAGLISAACRKDSGKASPATSLVSEKPVVASTPVEAQPPATSQVTPQADVPTMNLADALLGVVPALSRQMTLAEWRARYAADTIQPFDSKREKWPNDPDDTWCANASFDFTIESGLRGTRRVYFFVPPPEPARFPANPDGSLLDQCRAGMVQTEFDDPDSNRAGQTIEALKTKVAASLGPGEDVGRLAWYATTNWEGTRLWERDGAALAVGGGSYTAGNQLHNRIAAVGYGPASGMDVRFAQSSLSRARRDGCDDAAQRFASRLDEAVSLASVGGAIEARMRDAIRTARQKNYCRQTPTPAESAAMAESVLDWVGVSRALPAPRRAAALVAADGVLSRSGIATWKKDQNPPIRQRLEAAGAQFDWGELGAGYVYTHDWLQNAGQVDPDGRAGELAFLTLMEMGFHTGVGCAGSGTYGFETVTEEGLKYLRSKPNSAISADIHFLLVHAYADIVGLAAGLGYDSEREAETFRDQAATARTKAIEQYRLGVAAASASASARSSWPSAWRLMAGLSPSQTTFYCVYD